MCEKASATPRGLGARGLTGDLSTIERSNGAFDELTTDADECVAVSHANVISLTSDAVLLEQALKVARFGAVAPADVHENFANSAGVVFLLRM